MRRGKADLGFQLVGGHRTARGLIEAPDNFLISDGVLARNGTSSLPTDRSAANTYSIIGGRNVNVSLRQSKKTGW